MKPASLIIAALLVSTGVLKGQKGVDDGSKYGHGEDSIRCLTNLSLYSEYFKQKNYNDAFPYWEVAFNECPVSQMSLYPNGTVILKSFMDKEENAIKKEELFQYLMKVYDQRIKYFGNSTKYPTAYIQGIKAVDIIRYQKDNPESCLEAYNLMRDAVAGRGTHAQAAVLINHMANTAQLYKANLLKDEDVVNAYSTISDILEVQTANKPDNGDDATNADELKQTIEKLFAASGAATCETIDKIFGPQFEANSTNLTWLKRVSNLLSKQDCATDLVYKVSESLHKLEPSATSARGLALMCLKNKETDKAIGYYKQAIALEQNSENVGTLNYALGVVYMSTDNYALARSYFNKASEFRPGWGAPYIQIGVMYAASAKNCGTNEFEHKIAYWAAVDKFIKARTVDPTMADAANEKINLFSAYFPNKEELFFQGLQDGAPYIVGCWINETTTVRSKK